MTADTPTDTRIGQDVVEIVNPTGAGDFVIVCEHASYFIPADLDDLGLKGDILRSHIAWDPGALSIAGAMSVALDSPLVAHRVSRLVYDCNRPLEAESAIPARSEVHQIPGNTDLSGVDRQVRHDRFYVPFRQTLTELIKRKIDIGRPPILVTIHSFTPVYNGHKRDVEIGILHDSDSRLADSFLEVTAPDADFTIRRNEPYGPEDGVTHTLSAHAVSRGLLNVMFEIRNDLIADLITQRHIATWLSENLTAACETLRDTTQDTKHARTAQ